jgi:hypothetical protein
MSRKSALAWAFCLIFPPNCGLDRFDLHGGPKSGLDAAPLAESPTQKRVDAAPAAPGSVLSSLHAESWLIELPVEGFRTARVSVPLGARQSRPVVVALHGAGDRPEWACGGWRGVTDAYPFVVCPAGEPGGLPNGFVWGNDWRVEQEVNAAVEALRHRFGEHVAGGCTLLAGFSQGAIRMAPILARGGGFCPQAALCEGAYDALGKDFARAFVGWGGRRILLGCSQPYCAKVFREREAPLRGAGVDVRTVDSGGRTHNLNGEMVSTLREAWPWLVRDDERWSSYLEDRKGGPPTDSAN